jgi:phenylalanyl-tRNA synthetase beta chain
MKVLVSWLREFADLPASAAEIADALTHAGLEVEERLEYDALLAGLVVGEVRKVERHPKADRLTVCSVFDGEGERTVVCGAANVREGVLVPLARPGVVLPNGTKIESAELRGVRSDGMLCSEAELGLAEKSQGLLLLDEGAPGDDVAKVLGLSGDARLTLGVTPNRPDWLSHAGVAREAAAIFGRRFSLQMRPVAELGAPTRDRTNVRIEDAARCPRYAARVVEGVRVGPSPLWLRRRLERCGVRSINNVVDATNYVLLELGHPLHAFDLDRLSEQRIVVRVAREGEKLRTLDGAERVLCAEDLVIADASRPQALAGVMGGGDSEVSEETTRLLLESAYFEPRGVRRTARRHGLHTEASHRFERGADPEAVTRALDRVATLIVELAGGTILREAVDVYPHKIVRTPIALTWQRVSDLLGVEVSREESAELLRRLGVTAADVHQTGARFEPPSFRPDLQRDVDLIEEIVRLRGYRKIPGTLPAIRLAAAAERRAPRLRAAEAASRALCAAGLHEAINFGFIDPKRIAAMCFGEQDRRARPIALRNPISADLAVLRTSLLPWLVVNASHNLRHGVAAVHLFEVGRVFLEREAGAVAAGRDAPLPEERLLAAGICVGRRPRAAWQGGEAAATSDFYDAKGALEELLRAMGGSSGVTFTPSEVPYLHPRASAEVRVNAQPLGVIGELHPDVAAAFDVAARAFVFEIDLDRVAEVPERRVHFAELPRFPSVYRDVAVVVDADVPWASLRAEAIDAGGGLCSEVRVFDVYTGRPVPEGKKSVAFAITYRATDRTLTDDEVGRVHDAIRRRLEERLGARIRE